MRHFEGKTAVVTGGSGGFGQGIVRALAVEGAAVWALARHAEGLDRLAREVAGVQTLTADVTDPQTAPHTLRATRPDILVLNAGATPPWRRSTSNPGSSLRAPGRPMCR
jgi:NADP-dependent 3-hydroxy acid dehydrogenase YdfG